MMKQWQKTFSSSFLKYRTEEDFKTGRKTEEKEKTRQLQSFLRTQKQ